MGLMPAVGATAGAGAPRDSPHLRALFHVSGKKQSREKHPRAASAQFWEVMDRNHPCGRLWTEIACLVGYGQKSSLSRAQGPQGTSFFIKSRGLAAPSPAAARPPAPVRDAKEFKFKLILQIYLLCWRSAFPAAPEEKAPVVSSKTKVKGGAAARRGGKCRFLGAGGELVPEGPSLGLGRVSSPLKAAASPLHTSIKPL